ncbi:MAG: hypothetical protein C0475_05750 [Planctomyces sp.]|nr:hypothetical protein [Planctomyces sp.]MBA4119951.1 hypothetical protein [Isosphaera sp.]
MARINASTLLGSGQQPRSFLPEDYMRGKIERRSGIVSVLLFGVVMLGVVGAFIVTNRKWNDVRLLEQSVTQQVKRESEKLDQLKKLEATRGALTERAQSAAAVLERVPRSVLMAEITNRTPERLALIELNLVGKRVVEQAPKGDPKKGRAPSGRSATQAKGKPAEPEKPKAPKPPVLEFTIAINGLAATDQDVAEFQRRLKACELLANVELAQSAQSDVNGVALRRFRIDAQIKPSADVATIEPLHVWREELPEIPAPAKPEQKNNRRPTRRTVGSAQ